MERGGVAKDGSLTSSGSAFASEEGLRRGGGGGGGGKRGGRRPRRCAAGGFFPVFLCLEISMGWRRSTAAAGRATKLRSLEEPVLLMLLLLLRFSTVSSGKGKSSPRTICSSMTFCWARV